MKYAECILFSFIGFAIVGITIAPMGLGYMFGETIGLIFSVFYGVLYAGTIIYLADKQNSRKE